jgi:hypothetical protein
MESSSRCGKSFALTPAVVECVTRLWHRTIFVAKEKRMASNQPKDWRKLCEAAAKEEDPNKLMELVSEINKALDERNLKREGVSSERRTRDG